jgi:hypothetical protein
MGQKYLIEVINLVKQIKSGYMHHRVLLPEGQLLKQMFMRLVFSWWKLLICGRKPGNPDEENDYNNGISYWLWEFHRTGRLLDAADHKLNGEFAKDGLEQGRSLIQG